MIKDDINAQDWNEYEQYLSELDLPELYEELQYIIQVGEAKKSGKTLYEHDQKYLM